MPKYLVPIDLTGNEIQNVLIHKLASAPSSPTEGQIYYDTAAHKLYYRTDSGWQDVTNALTLGGQNSAYHLDRTNHTGAQAQSTITNLVTDLAAKAPLASPTFTGVPAAPTASGGTNTTQLATTAYVVAEIAARLAAADALVYKGAIDASTNPNYPAGDAGDTYRISVAGKIGGASGPNVEAGDLIILHVDSSAGGTHASVGADWDIIQTNIDGVPTVASTTEVLTGTDATKFVTPDALAALWEQGSDIASAGTISVGDGGYFAVTGNTTITDIDFGTDKTGRAVLLKFAPAILLTHSSTLMLPGQANITTTNGDVGLFVSEGSDAVRCVFYQRISGGAPLNYANGTNTSFQYNNSGVLASVDGATYDGTNFLFSDSRLRIVDDGDASKLIAFQLSGLTPATTRTWTFPDSSDTFVGLTTSQTLTNKTLTTPTIGSFANANHDHTNSAGGGTLPEAALALTDITTNNATTSAHGFLKKLSNSAAEYMDGTGNWSTPAGGGTVVKFSQDIGDNSTTAIVVTHNLGTRDVTVAVREAGSPYAFVYCDIEATTTNTITLTFAIAPTTAQFRVTIHA